MAYVDISSFLVIIRKRIVVSPLSSPHKSKTTMSEALPQMLTFTFIAGFSGMRFSRVWESSPWPCKFLS